MLHALRVLFILFSAAMGWYIAADPLPKVLPPELNVRQYFPPWLGGATGLLAATLLVVLEWNFTKRFVAIVSVLMFGIVFGFVLSYLVVGALFLIPGLIPPETKGIVQYVLTCFCCYLSIVAILQSKDDFKFVIPFIEFSREGRRGRPWLLDTSVIVDGRIADLCETKIVDAPLVVARFVLDELQQIADSADKAKRARGRRGLDVLGRLRKNRALDVQINEMRLPEIEGVDAKLVRMARLIDARLVTQDFNLNKVAQVQGIEVINLNDLAGVMRAPVLPGEQLTLKIVKRGEEPEQGVGYLEDGTMVVAEGCAGRVGETVTLAVTSVIQRSAGRMVFGRAADPVVPPSREPERAAVPPGG
jgi:uncharacterized protein YacL